MLSEPQLEAAKVKSELRERAHAARNAQENKDELSRHIFAKFLALPEYAAAKTVMFYLDVRSEVRTRHSLEDALASGKRVVVPYCVDGELELFHLESVGELEVVRPEEHPLVPVDGARRHGRPWFPAGSFGVVRIAEQAPTLNGRPPCLVALLDGRGGDVAPDRVATRVRRAVARPPTGALMGRPRGLARFPGGARMRQSLPPVRLIPDAR